MKLVVGFDSIDLRFAPASALEIAKRFCVNGEEPHGRAVFRSHVRDGRAVGKGHSRKPRSVELDELFDDPLLPENLGHGEDEVGRGHSFTKAPDELKSDHFRHDEVRGLPEHRRLGLDPADAPTENSEAVDHRGVRVGSDESVGEEIRLSVSLFPHHHFREVLEVHLVDDARRRRNDAKVVERLLAPPQELVALAVALELDLGVALERERSSEDVHLDRVIDDQIDGNRRVDAGRVASEPLHRAAHGSQIDDRGNAGEVLEDHPRGKERHFLRTGLLRIPAGERLDVGFGGDSPVAVPEGGFEKDLDAEGKSRERWEPGFLEPLELKHGDVLVRSRGKWRSRAKGVSFRFHHHR